MLFDDLKKGRKDILVLMNRLSDDQCQRIGIHPAYGSMTIEAWTEFFLLHEAHHFLTIFKLAGQIRTTQ
jgi:hypothetical protein